jgi:glucokinase
MKQLIAIDLGGTNIRTALFDASRKPIRTVYQPTKIGHLESLLHQVKETILQLEPIWDDVLAIAIGVPGRVSGTGKIDVLPNINVFNVPLQQYLFDAFKKPVYVENDAVMASIAEGNLGIGKHASSSFFLTISTGIGGAFISNHKVKIASEEIGHMLVSFNDQFYELESLASGNGIVRLASLHGLQINSAIEFFNAVSRQEPLALSTLASWLNLLETLFRFIQTTFEPEMIILTGGVLKSKHLFLDQLKERVPNLNLQFAQFGQDAGLIGAAEFGYMQHQN